MDSDSLFEIVRHSLQCDELRWNGSAVRNRTGRQLVLSDRGQAALQGVVGGTVIDNGSLEQGALLQLIAFYLLDHGRLTRVIDYSTFIDEGKEFVQPGQVSIEITKWCNLRCLHCYNDSGKRDAHELADSEKLAMARYLGRWGVRMVSITGGEPVLDSSFPELLSLASEYRMAVKVTTNGWKIPRELLAAIEAGTVMQVTVSLDGADEATHDAFRGRQGSYRRVLRSMQILGECRPRILQLNASIHTISVHQMEALADLALKYRFDSISFKPVTSSGRQDGRVDFLLSLADLRLYQTERARLAALYGGRLHVEGNILGGAVPASALDRISCNAAERSMLILANGRMTPCAALNADSWAPDIRTISPMEAWLTHPLFQDFRAMKRTAGNSHAGCPGSRFASANSSQAVSGLRVLQ
jgi:MoaA/NifB/PqqE/SkfB family radical SAM enzyme